MGNNSSQLDWEEQFDVIGRKTSSNTLLLAEKSNPSLQYIGAILTTSTENQNHCYKEILLAKQRNPTSFVTPIQDSAIKEETEQCCIHHRYYILYRKPQRTLWEEMQMMLHYGTQFSPQKLHLVLDRVAKGLFYLHEVDDLPKDLTLNDICVSQENQVQLIDPFLTNKYRSRQQAILIDAPYFPAPQQLYSNPFQEPDYFASNLFTLGINMLQIQDPRNSMVTAYGASSKMVDWGLVEAKCQDIEDTLLRQKIKILTSRDKNRRKRIGELLDGGLSDAQEKKEHTESLWNQNRIGPIQRHYKGSISTLQYQPMRNISSLTVNTHSNNFIQDKNTYGAYNGNYNTIKFNSYQPPFQKYDNQYRQAQTTIQPLLQTTIKIPTLMPNQAKKVANEGYTFSKSSILPTNPVNQAINRPLEYLKPNMSFSSMPTQSVSPIVTFNKLPSQIPNFQFTPHSLNSSPNYSQQIKTTQNDIKNSPQIQSESRRSEGTIQEKKSLSIASREKQEQREDINSNKQEKYELQIESEIIFSRNSATKDSKQKDLRTSLDKISKEMAGRRSPGDQKAYHREKVVPTSESRIGPNNAAVSISEGSLESQELQYKETWAVKESKEPMETKEPKDSIQNRSTQQNRELAKGNLLFTPVMDCTPQRQNRQRSYPETIKEEEAEEDMEYVVECYEIGSKYEGFKKNGMRNGKGKFYYQQGSLYDGEWCDNKMHGRGKLYYASGQLAYQGEWCMDEFHGWGKVYNNNPVMEEEEFDYRNFNNLEEQWRYYEGELKMDGKEGHGVIMLHNGQYFEGQFRNDKLNGPGVFHTRHGDVIEGVWKDSILVDVQ